MSVEQALFDAVGPRARRRIRVVTVLSVLALAGLFTLAYAQFYRSGQLAPSKWRELYDPVNIRYLGTALGNTARAAGMAALISLPAGLVMALGRLSPVRPLRWAATAYIEIFRAVPVLLIIYIFLSALPQYGINPDVFWKLVIPISLCASATLAEVFRAGVLAVPRGQTEAGLSIGLTRGQTSRLVILPQALRMVVPALVAQGVILVKDTTFGWVVSYAELQQASRVLVATTHDYVQTYLVVAVVYIVINVIISHLAQRLDTTLARRRSGRGRSYTALLPGRVRRSPARASDSGRMGG